MILINGKLEDIEDAVKEEESVKSFLNFRDRNKENPLTKGQNLIGLEFLSWNCIASERRNACWRWASRVSLVRDAWLVYQRGWDLAFGF